MEYDSFDTDLASVFKFGQNSGSDDEFRLTNNNYSSTRKIHWTIDGDGFEKSACWDLEWTHVVVIACGNTTKIYKKGQLADVSTDVHESRTMTRENHCTGSKQGSGSFPRGKVAYFPHVTYIWQAS